MPSNKRGRNNNPEGHNQYSNGWMDTAKERPFAAATVAAATVGAGVFLWSRRNQISEQLSNLSDQIGEWTDGMRQGQSDQFEMADGGSMSSSSGNSGMSSGSMGGSSTGGSSTGSGGSSRSGSSGRKSGSRSTGMSETGGGNASLGAHSGGSGISS